MVSNCLFCFLFVQISFVQILPKIRLSVDRCIAALLAGTAVSQRGQVHKFHTKLRTGWSDMEKGRKMHIKSKGTQESSPTSCCLDLWELPTSKSQEIPDRPRTNLKFHQKQEEDK